MPRSEATPNCLDRRARSLASAAREGSSGASVGVAAPSHGGCCAEPRRLGEDRDGACRGTLGEASGGAERPRGRRFRRPAGSVSAGGAWGRLWVAVMSRHSERQAALPRRRKRSILRLTCCRRRPVRSCPGVGGLCRRPTHEYRSCIGAPIRSAPRDGSHPGSPPRSMSASSPIRRNGRSSTSSSTRSWRLRAAGPATAPTAGRAAN